MTANILLQVKEHLEFQGYEFKDQNLNEGMVIWTSKTEQVFVGVVDELVILRIIFELEKSKQNEQFYLTLNEANSQSLVTKWIFSVDKGWIWMLGIQAHIIGYNKLYFWELLKNIENDKKKLLENFANY